MNELDALKILMSSMGGGGLAAFFAWLLFKAYTAAVAKSLEIQEKRIDAVEKRSQVCEDDRKLLRAELMQIQGSAVTETRNALYRSVEALEGLTRLAESRGWSIIIDES